MTTRFTVGVGMVVLMASLAGSAGAAGNTAASGNSPEAVVRRAYQEVLGRAPDEGAMRTYRPLIVEKGWTEQQVCDALRQSDEYKTVGRQRAAPGMVKRAYQDVLGRDPDPAGLKTFTAKIVEQNWSEDDVRNELRKSKENTEAAGLTQKDAEAIVRGAYREVLGRNADPDGLALFTQRILRDHWNKEAVEKELKKSPEYKQKRK